MIRRSSRPGTLTLGWNPRKRESFEASERPLRAGGPVQEKFSGASGGVDLAAGETGYRGAERQSARLS